MIDEIDEFDPTTDSKEQILADLKESFRQSELGQTFPLSELWNEIFEQSDEVQDTIAADQKKCEQN
ncbi:hypothetical protein ACQ4M3_29880 [Leptolyngbya sp. AN03gr2]|uniref:hypothetical protein n=1 Tax=unclassified Leptolyngbya TaxID=2650499 RepID=UPI003D321702